MIKDDQKIRDFISNTKELLKIEKDEEEEQLKELLKTTELKRLEKLGLCITDLKIKKISMGMFNKPVIHMNHSLFEKNRRLTKENGNDDYLNKVRLSKENNKIRNGDLVAIYQWSKESRFISGTPDFTGSVDHLGEFKAKIVTQENDEKNIFKADYGSIKYVMVQMVNEVTFQRYRKCLDRL